MMDGRGPFESTGPAFRTWSPPGGYRHEYGPGHFVEDPYARGESTFVIPEKRDLSFNPYNMTSMPTTRSAASLNLPNYAVPMSPVPMSMPTTRSAASLNLPNYAVP